MRKMYRAELEAYYEVKRLQQKFYGDNDPYRLLNGGYWKLSSVMFWLLYWAGERSELCFSVLTNTDFDGGAFR